MPIIQSQPETSGSPKTYLFCDRKIIPEFGGKVNGTVTFDIHILATCLQIRHILHRFYKRVLLNLT